MRPKAVLVETNWVMDVIAPAHLQNPQAIQLLTRAQAGEFDLYVPAICLTEARETVPRRFLDSDLQPWDKSRYPKPILRDLYDQARIWVYNDFLLEDIDAIPDRWTNAN